MKKHFIQDAINPNHKGLLRKELKVKGTGPIPESKLQDAIAKGGVVGRRALLARTLRNLKK